MRTFDVTLRHVNNPDNVVVVPGVDASNENYAADQAKRMYMLPANWEVVSVVEVTK